MRERPTVVLLHGGPGSFDHTYFKPEFARLTEVAQVVYLDLNGHGRSDRGKPSAWSFETPYLTTNNAGQSPAAAWPWFMRAATPRDVEGKRALPANDKRPLAVIR